MIEIYLETIWQKRFFLFWWCVSIAIFCLVIFAVYPSIRDQAAELSKTFEQLPETIRSLKGNNDDMLSPIGFLNSQLYYATLPLMLGIMAISLGNNLLAKDEQDHTLELLLSRPISRSKILAAKGLAGVTLIIITALVTTLVIISGSEAVDINVSFRNVVITTFITALLPLSFGAISFCLNAIGRFAKLASIGIASGFAIGGYLLASLAGLTDIIEFLARAFPYYYFKPYDMLQDGRISLALLGYIFAIMTLSGIISWQSFRKRDIE